MSQCPLPLGWGHSPPSPFFQVTIGNTMFFFLGLVRVRGVGWAEWCSRGLLGPGSQGEASPSPVSHGRTRTTPDVHRSQLRPPGNVDRALGSHPSPLRTLVRAELRGSRSGLPVDKGTQAEAPAWHVLSGPCKIEGGTESAFPAPRFLRNTRTAAVSPTWEYFPSFNSRNTHLS